jgi:hypothetical protein
MAKRVALILLMVSVCCGFFLAGEFRVSDLYVTIQAPSMIDNYPMIWVGAPPIIAQSFEESGKYKVFVLDNGKIEMRCIIITGGSEDGLSIRPNYSEECTKDDKAKDVVIDISR